MPAALELQYFSLLPEGVRPDPSDSSTWEKRQQQGKGGGGPHIQPEVPESPFPTQLPVPGSCVTKVTLETVSQEWVQVCASPLNLNLW